MTARVVGSLFVAATTAGVISAVLHGTTTGALMVLLMAVAIALIAPAIFPVLKQYGEAVALSYVVMRTVEVVLLLPAAIGPGFERWGHTSVVFFCLSAALLNWQLYRSRLVPRWISIWALIAVVPYLSGGTLVWLGMFTQVEAGALFVPLAVNEMTLAVWLLVKGFSREQGSTLPEVRGMAPW